MVPKGQAMVQTLQPSAGCLVDSDGLDRAGVHTPRLVALGAGVGDLPAGLVEVEHLDARLRRVEHPVVLLRAGHLALHAAGAFGGIEMQGSHHGVLAPDSAGVAELARPVSRVFFGAR
jgi:hypothetical protein